MNSLLRFDPFKGTLYDAAIHNWMIARRTYLPGLPIAVTVDAAHSPVGLDLAYAKALGLTETTSIGIMAAQGYGKTFLAMFLALIKLITHVGTGFAKIDFPSLKHNNGRPETAPLVEDVAGCKIISPFRVRLNPLARALDLSFDAQYAMIGLMLQFMYNVDLTIYEEDVLSEVLRDHYDNEPNPSFPTLYDRLGQYNFVAEEGSIRAKHQGVFEKAALDLQIKIKSLMTGFYGTLFSGDGSEIVELYQQKIISWDFKGVSDRTRSLIKIVLNAIDMSNILPDPTIKEGEPGYNQPKHPERIASTKFMDEAWSAFRNLFTAETTYEDLKTGRSSGIDYVILFHRLADLQQAIGSNNSQQLEYARNALKEIETWLLGRQHESALDDIREFFPSLPEYIVQSLTTLPKGHFWLITPWNAPVLVAIIGTKLAIRHFNTDGANHRLLKKYFETKNHKYYIEYLKDTTESDEEFAKKDPANQPAPVTDPEEAPETDGEILEPANS